MMATLCAQCRDENIQKLRTINDPTDCFRFNFYLIKTKKKERIYLINRGIMEVLSLMKVDMANFNIRQYRPLLQQQAIDYEKTTFDKFMENKRGFIIII